MAVTREALRKGKDQYSWPHCINLFRSATFYMENIIPLLLQNELPKLGGQPYWTFPFS